MDNIKRIQAMEDKLDRAGNAVAALDAALEQFEAVIPEIQELAAYYESELWRKDFEDDAAGRLPAGLKRGVLSEDGIYDLLTDYQRLKTLAEEQ